MADKGKPVINVKDREKSPRKSTRTKTAVLPVTTKILVGDFHDSASEFKEYEEGQLNISNTYEPSITSLFPDFDYTQDFNNVSGFKDAMLAGINYTELLNMGKCETQKQRTLLRKLQAVFTNNYSVEAAALARDETAIDDFVHFLLNLLNFDAWPIEVRSKPLLNLEIGDWLFAAIADFGIRSDDTVYLSVLTDKHRKSTTYNKGKLQLACGMIAGAQAWYRDDAPPPFNMFGILVVADQFAFVRASITKAYLDCLLEKVTPPPLEFHWWPAESRTKYPNQATAKTVFGIHYGDVDQRETIVKTLCLLQRKFFAEVQV